jgi:hypothetical protein
MERRDELEGLVALLEEVDGAGAGLAVGGELEAADEEGLEHLALEAGERSFGVVGLGGV